MGAGWCWCSDVVVLGVMVLKVASLKWGCDWQRGGGVARGRDLSVLGSGRYDGRSLFGIRRTSPTENVFCFGRQWWPGGDGELAGEDE
ncbi:hypothetical protein Tco_0206860 [Tanacetum coccineum]